MKYILGKFALILFDIISAKQGYKFRKVKNNAELRDANRIYAEEGFTLPEELRDKVAVYKKGTINFIAYYKGIPVGTVRLADPAVINRPYELYGTDVAGEHHEIQSLLVKKDHRDCSQFVMIGLFRAMYCYSTRNGICSWSSCGSRNVYLTIRRLCKNIHVADLDFSAIQNPITKYLHDNHIIETYFTMSVADFSPWDIFKKCLKRLLKKWNLAELHPAKIFNFSQLKFPQMPRALTIATRILQ